MHNLKSNIAIIIALLSLALNVYFLVHLKNQKRIAYIRSSELVYGYLGMQEAHRAYEEKNKSWQANMDTLQKDYQLAVSKYTTDAPKLAKEEREEMEKMLEQQKKSLLGYVKSITEKSKEEDDKITQAVLNQVNSFVEEYGKNKGYEIILGTTLSGNLLYGDDAMDITKEVLENLNKNYKGETVK